MAEEIDVQAELIKFKALQKQYQKAVDARRHLGSQLHENTTVQEELNLVKDSQEVYKLIGPVLVKQDIIDAKEHVSKRLAYINGELKRVDENVSDLQRKLSTQRAKLTKIQQESVRQLATKSSTI